MVIWVFNHHIGFDPFYPFYQIYMAIWVFTHHIGFDPFYPFYQIYMAIWVFLPPYWHIVYFDNYININKTISKTQELDLVFSIIN